MEAILNAHLTQFMQKVQRLIDAKQTPGTDAKQTPGTDAKQQKKQSLLQTYKQSADTATVAPYQIDKHASQLDPGQYYLHAETQLLFDAKMVVVAAMQEDVIRPLTAADIKACKEWKFAYKRPVDDIVAKLNAYAVI